MATDDFDFGFTAVTAEELGALVQPTTPPPVSQPQEPVVSDEMAGELLDKIESLERAIAALKPDSTDELAVLLDEVDARNAQMRAECKGKLQEVERLILPLLQNLMKNPEKPYILWANRSERIAAQIDKITAVTRSYGV